MDSPRPLLRDLEMQGGPVVGLDRWPRPVRGELERGRRPRQPLVPVSESTLERVALQPLPLPVGEVAVLQRRLWRPMPPSPPPRPLPPHATPPHKSIPPPH